jgi:transposase
LLPDATLLRLEAWSVDDTTAQISLLVRSTQTSVPCPGCATPARRIHSRYTRILADLPWAAYRVHLQLCVRKWCCRNRACPRRIFTERLPTIAAPWARRTLRLAQRLIALGVALGGKAGAHLSHQWDLVMSRNTLLRLLRRQPALSFPTPTVLGVDDFALRKRHTYGYHLKNPWLKSACCSGLPAGEKTDIMACSTRPVSPLEHAALCSKTLTCTASPMNRHANS